MGASESTAARSNGTKEDDEKRRQDQNGSGGSYIGAATAIATGVVVLGTAAWGISKMLSDNTQNQEVHHQSSIPNPPEEIKQRWSPRYKMNTDGACRPVSGSSVGPSGYGGILRNHHGKWIQGFIGFIGDDADSLTSEFHGILRGLEVLDKLELKGAILETDCKAACEWVDRCDDDRGKSKIIEASWDDIIEKCRELVYKNDIDIRLIPRETNRCADKLANMALIDRSVRHLVIRDLPDELKDLVEQDAKLFNA